MPSDSHRPPEDETTTGLPGLHSWRAVYLTVLGTFVLWVVLLTVFSRWFS